MQRRQFLAASSAVGLASAMRQARPALAQRGEGTLKLIYGFAAGDAADTLARIIAERLGQKLGVPAIVENRGGASGRIGTKAVISAEPDGMTILFSPMGPAALHPVSYPNSDFDVFRDLEPVSQAATFDIGVVVGPAVPVRTVKELTAWLRAHPDKASYGTPGLGGLPHFFAVMFATAAGIQIRNVPYRGAAAVMNDVLSGQLPFAFSSSSSYTELHNSGRVRILATSSRARNPFVKDVPTFKEEGYDLEGLGWYSLYAPLKTPQDRITRISTVVQEMMREPDVIAKVNALGLVPTGTSADELRRLQAADRALWTPAIKASGFRPTD